ncbi:MAG: hypothetical protein Q4G59_07495, partial [Planctomycetia bacterium]|nr:hypothetical protein [Planctomycetia bacterium]
DAWSCFFVSQDGKSQSIRWQDVKRIRTQRQNLIIESADCLLRLPTGRYARYFFCSDHWGWQFVSFLNLMVWYAKRHGIDCTEITTVRDKIIKRQLQNRRNRLSILTFAAGTVLPVIAVMLALSILVQRGIMPPVASQGQLALLGMFCAVYVLWSVILFVILSWRSRVAVRRQYDALARFFSEEHTADSAGSCSFPEYLNRDKVNIILKRQRTARYLPVEQLKR